MRSLAGSTMLALMGTAVVGTSAVAQEAGGFSRRVSTDWLDLALHWITRAIEIGGIAVILVGAVGATVTYLRRRSTGPELAYHQYRAGLGRAILLGLEFLVAADIIGTVAIEPNLDSLAVLAGIILIRTFLSVSLEVEIEGRWPWRRAAASSSDDRPTRPPTG